MMYPKFSARSAVGALLLASLVALPACGGKQEDDPSAGAGGSAAGAGGSAGTGGIAAGAGGSASGAGASDAGSGGSDAGAGGSGAAGGSAGAAGQSEAGSGGAGGCGVCPDEAPKCNAKGECVKAYWCDSDADCTGSLPACDTYNHRCAECNAAHPCTTPDRPVCVNFWEDGHSYCAECRVSDPTTCPGGQLCAGKNPLDGGTCEVVDCASGPGTDACETCKQQSKGNSVSAKGACAKQHAEVLKCAMKQDPEAYCYPPYEGYCSELAACEGVVKAARECVEAQFAIDCP